MKKVAQRAASKSRINPSREISSPDIARGDQRSIRKGSIWWSASRISLPLTIYREMIAVDPICVQAEEAVFTLAAEAGLQPDRYHVGFGEGPGR